MTERERMTKLISELLSTIEGSASWANSDATAMRDRASALESLVTARAMLGEEPVTAGASPDPAQERMIEFAKRVLVRTKHGPGGTGQAGPCDSDCVKCEAEAILLGAIDANTIGVR